MVTDEPTSLLDGYGLTKILIQYIDKNKLFLLVNNVIDYEDANDVTYKLNLASDKFLGVNLNYLGFVPYERLVRQSIVQQELFVNTIPESEVSNAIAKLSQKLIEMKLKS
jgi:flagellar biosynthesis protein FlhG